MPGSIQVSVLGFMDHASAPPLSSLSLRVSMGKEEYRTVGGGELSLPVVSLRENLIVMVHDAEGEEILRTEFITMLLLERGLWDDSFPLKNGGSLQMKLQFLLSEDDRKRIREMRDAALKKRCVEKPRIRHRRSFSDNRIGYSPTKRIAESVSEGMLLDHSVLAEPIVEPSSAEQREKLPADITGEKDSSNLNSPQTISKSFSVGIFSDISSEGKSMFLKEPIFLKKTHNSIPAMHYETPRNKDFKDAGPLHSAKFGSYVLVDNGSNTIGSEKSTSERKEFASVVVRKGSSILPIIRNFETSRVEGDLNLIRKEDSGGGGLGSNVTSKESFSSHGSTDITCKKRNAKTMTGDGIKTSYEGVERKINTVDDDDNEYSNEEHNLRNGPLPSTKLLENLGRLEEVVGTERDENMLERPLNEQIGRAEHTTAGKKHNCRISSEGSDDDDKENEDESLGGEYLPNEQGTLVKVAETLKNDEIALQSPSNEIVEALNSCFDWVCPIGILGIWTPRRLCVTTGSKLLREIAEIYGCSSMQEDDTKLHLEI
ncbi:uncharacterized protein LOC110017970 isoform X3 [Phalaenopsis equestris]|uniref:uncharacterized protein LOC110017970 isoform X3 n=1 Tax=Phalaenopsis equestris TaxID=78828 RepID=UPI0009E20DC2|nr:uncharacterized protein LOC110017970 isoform X3 [Phalaenopsis equestris]